MPSNEPKQHKAPVPTVRMQLDVAAPDAHGLILAAILQAAGNHAIRRALGEDWVLDVPLLIGEQRSLARVVRADGVSKICALHSAPSPTQLRAPKR